MEGRKEERKDGTMKKWREESKERKKEGTLLRT